MAVYTVHEPPLRARETTPDPERFVFVRDGFYVWAFLLTPLWMLRHRLWLVLLLYLLLCAGIDSVVHALGVSRGDSALIFVLLALLVGLEASTLRRFALARRGFRNVGVVEGGNIETAERRFFASWSADQPAQPPAPSSSVPPLPPIIPPSDIVGLFPEPGAP